MIRVCIVLLIAVLGLSSAYLYERASSRIKLQDQTIISLQEQVKRDATTIQEERAWAKNRENVIAALLQIGKDIQNMQDEVRQQDKQRAAALKELIKNDKAIRDYMALAVPAKLGLQYERKATTDPTQYGPSGSVPTGSVPTAGKGAATK